MNAVADYSNVDGLTSSVLRQTANKSHDLVNIPPLANRALGKATVGVAPPGVPQRYGSSVGEPKPGAGASDAELDFRDCNWSAHTGASDTPWHGIGERSGSHQLRDANATSRSSHTPEHRRQGLRRADDAPAASGHHRPSARIGGDERSASAAARAAGAGRGRSAAVRQRPSRRRLAGADAAASRDR